MGRLAKFFGGALREQRLAAGLSQEELAQRADVHRTFVSLLERGKRSPSLEIIVRLAEALDIPAEQLLAETLDAARETQA